MDAIVLLMGSDCVTWHRNDQRRWLCLLLDARLTGAQQIQLTRKALSLT